jgi:hypothetical protein
LNLQQSLVPLVLLVLLGLWVPRALLVRKAQLALMERMERRGRLAPRALLAPPVNLGSLGSLVRLASARAQESIK